MPPAALTSSTASSRPFSASCASNASGPVTGRIYPSLTSLPWARPTAGAAATTAAAPAAFSQSRRLTRSRSMTASLPRGARSSYTYRARGVNAMADLTEAQVQALASALQLPLTTEDAPEVTHRLNAFIEALASLVDLASYDVDALVAPVDPDH